MAKHIWKLEATPRHIRTTFNDETIGDSKNALLLIENPYTLDYFFPLEDIRQDVLVASDHTERSGLKGTAHFWHVKVGDRIAENAAWTYPETIEGRPDLSRHIAFKWKAMDHWYEEAEEVFLHPRNPYHRVDTIKSNRHVEVFIDGQKIADTTTPHLLFETGIKPRYYIPPEDIRVDLLTATDTHSICPYKGTADYWSATVNGETYQDVIWGYPDPIPETPKIKGLMAFWDEKDKRIEIHVDGEKV